jgi:hypothetical protein
MLPLAVDSTGLEGHHMTKRLGRFARQNTIALLALFIALGGTSYAAATLINGSQIKKHTIAKNRLTNKAIKQLKGNHGPRGLQGARGPTGAAGAAGARGATGPQGPGGGILTYDAAASASTTPKVLGTVLGDTIGATCTIPAAGETTITVYMKTSDGSWNIDYSYLTYDSAITPPGVTYISRRNFPAGTFNSLLAIDSRHAPAGQLSEGQLDFVQLGPSPGNMIWHESAFTNPTQTCHLSVMSFPTTISGVTGSPTPASPAHARAPLRLTP